MPKLCIDTITFGSSVVLSSERARLYFDAKLVWQACKKPKEQRVNLQKESVGSEQIVRGLGTSNTLPRADVDVMNKT